MINKTTDRANTTKHITKCKRLIEKGSTKLMESRITNSKNITSKKYIRGDRKDAPTYIASQVRAFTIAGVNAARRGVPVVAIVVTRALTVELAIAVGNVTLEGL
jgi:hypothetical protein